jgi:16S rRNA (guanine527-N7)-methyltransferase
MALNAAAVAALSSYYALLMRWNRKLNLTALRDDDSALDRLLLEPVCAVPYIGCEGRLLDLGSGGGSPAIPLKLMLKSLDLTMVEARTRKAAFLREAVRQLALPRARVEQMRYEELLKDPKTQGGYDVVTIRAVRVDRTSLISLRPLLSITGWIMLFHGVERPDWPKSECVSIPLLAGGASELTVIPAMCLNTVPRGTAEPV